MKKTFFILIYFIFLQTFSQEKFKDSIFVLYKGDTELIKMAKSKIKGFGILLDIYKNKNYRDSIAKRYRNRGGRTVPFYIGFTGVKNYIINNSIDKYPLTSIEDISKLKVNHYNPTKIFFIEKLECNKYKFHETHQTSD